MKTKLLLFLLCMATLSGYADDNYSYLAFETADGTTATETADNLHITFANGQLIATSTATSNTYTLTDLTRMYFTNTPVTAINELATGNEGNVEVYSAQGISMGTFASMQAARSLLKQGLYIVKSDSGTFKMTVR